MRQIFGEHLVKLSKTNPEMVVLDADVSCSTQTCLFGKAFPDRFINCGIAEANMVSVAAGIAAAGLRPVISSFAYLLATRALDQIRSQIAYNSLPVIIAGGYAGLSDFADGGSHQSIEDLAIFSSMPNMTVICPGDANEVELALEMAMRHEGPVYIRLSRAETPRLASEQPFEIGKAITYKHGEDIALLSTGQMLPRVLEAAELLSKAEIKAEVLHLHTVKPIDEQAVLGVARKCKAVVTCEENSVKGGLGSIVASLLSQKQPTDMRMIGISDAFGQSGSYDDLLEHYGLSPSHITMVVKKMLSQELRRQTGLQARNVM